MPRTGRRYKVYSAATGISYRYSFEGQRRVVRPEGQGAGIDFTFALTADQSLPFTLRVFVSDRALAAWCGRHGRELEANEQYALAKMCLFRAFDELDGLRERALSLVVDETNVEELLAPLDLA